MEGKRCHDRDGYEKAEYVGKENIKEGVWTGGRIRNVELREMYEDLDILAGIKKKRLVWIGHVVRMDHGS